MPEWGYGIRQVNRYFNADAVFTGLRKNVCFTILFYAFPYFLIRCIFSIRYNGLCIKRKILRPIANVVKGGRYERSCNRQEHQHTCQHLDHRRNSSLPRQHHSDKPAEHRRPGHTNKVFAHRQFYPIPFKKQIMLIISIIQTVPVIPSSSPIAPEKSSISSDAALTSNAPQTAAVTFKIK